MKKWMKWVLILALIAGILAAVVYWYVTRQYDNTKTIKADFTTTVAAFGAEFNTNDSLTNAKYNNKTVEISGTINEIIFADTTAVIKLTDTITGLDIVCDFQPQSVAEVKNLKEGNAVIIKGICTGLLNIVAKKPGVIKTDSAINQDDETSMIDGTDQSEEASMLDEIKSVSIIRCAIVTPNKK